MPLKILHAADASGAADELATALRRERNRDATILLVSTGLDNATNKNDILRNALAAANDGTLVVVRTGDATAPIGTRDSPTVDWPPSGDIKTVRDAVAKSLPKSRAKRPWGWLIGLSLAAVVLLVLTTPLLFTQQSTLHTEVSQNGSLLEQTGRLPGISGRWAANQQQCPTTYLDLSFQSTGLLVSDGRSSQIQAFAGLTGDAVLVVDSAGAEVTYRLNGDTLSVTHAGQASEFIRCSVGATPQTSAASSADVQAMRAELRGIETDLSDARATATATSDVVYSIDSRLNLLFLAVGVLLAWNVIAAIVRWLRRPKTKSPKSAPVVTGSAIVASYSRQDGQMVDELIKEIERGGVDVWIDRTDIGAGSTWSESIVRAIRGSRGLILFCSEHAFQSDHVLRELNLADSCRKPVYPVMLEPVAVPDSFLYYLSTRQMVDLKSDPDWRSKLREALQPNVRELQAE